MSDFEALIAQLARLEPTVEPASQSALLAVDAATLAKVVELAACTGLALVKVALRAREMELKR